jgi:hypothetical protein
MSNPKRCLSLVTPVFYREDQPMPAPMVAPEPVVSLTRVDVVLAHPVATVSATSAAVMSGLPHKIGKAAMTVSPGASESTSVSAPLGVDHFAGKPAGSGKVG